MILNSILCLVTLGIGHFQNPVSTGQLQAFFTATKTSTAPVLVKIPFSQASIYLGDEVGSTATYQNGFPENSDGSGTAINVSVPANTISDYQSIHGSFDGSEFGVRWRYNASASFTVQVDEGSPFAVLNPEAHRTVEGRVGPLNYEVQQITHTGLAPGHHTFRLMFASGQNAVLLGLVVDEVAKAPPITRVAQVGHSGLVGVGPSNAATFLPYNPSVGTSAYFAYTSKVIYSNWTSSPITIYFSGASASVSGATVSNPCVLTVSNTSGIVTGTPICIYNVGGTTTANSTTPIFAQVLTSSTIALFSDAACTSGIAGVGTYSSGGTVLYLNLQHSIPANDIWDASFTTPVGSSLWSQFCASAGVTYLPVGGFFN